MNPALLSAAYEPEAHNDFIWAVVGSPWGLLALWLVLINAAAFLAFGLDKWKARRKEKNEKVRRVPERTLLLLAALTCPPWEGVPLSFLWGWRLKGRPPCRKGSGQTTQIFV